MYCKKCGNSINDGDTFCGRCGELIERKLKCPDCGAELEANKKFCTSCGLKLPDKPSFDKKENVSYSGSVVPPPRSYGKKIGKGDLLRKINMITKHKGEPTVTLNHVSGCLSVYDNRIEFHNSLGMSLIETVKVRNNGDDIFNLEQISRLSNGTYMGMYTTLVIELKNGDKYSFVPAVPGNTAMKEVIELLSPYM